MGDPGTGEARRATGADETRAAWVEALLSRHEQPLIRYTARITGDAERARDVVQDAFVKLCGRRRAELAGREAAWLYTVCRNRALDVRRKEGRMGSLPRQTIAALPSRGDGPGEAAARNEAHRLVIAALGTLPNDEQEAFRLKFHDQLSYREIGQVMGVSLGTVSALITRGLASVRQQLQAADAVREV